MRFDELVMRIEDEELRLRFHPELTVLCGLGALERQSLADRLLAALTAGAGDTALRYTDGTGRAATLAGAGGRAEARFEDGSSAPTPIGTIADTPASLRSLILVRAADLGVADPLPRDDEPAELREARATLAELTAELDDTLRQRESQSDVRARLEDLDDQITTARYDQARREYAQVLVQLDRVRAEAAAVQSSVAAIEADRQLLTSSTEVAGLARRWRAAVERLAELVDGFGDGDRLAPEELGSVATTPTDPPAGLAEAVHDVDAARAERDELDHRLQALAVATLPAPSDPAVAELGLLDQDELWGAAERLTRSLHDMEQLQVAHGGLNGEGGPAPAVLDEIEAAHAALEQAERAAESTRVAGVAASALGVAVALAGTLAWTPLIAVGLLLAIAAGATMLVAPKQRVAGAARAERDVLASAGATTYLGFHIRRVDASIDPRMREEVALAMVDQRRAETAWADLVGPNVDVHLASELEAEVRAYHEALRNLGGAADEIEELRSALAERAEPALAAALDQLTGMCEPYGLSGANVVDTSDLEVRVGEQIDRGALARLQVEVEAAEAAEREVAGQLADLLMRVGFADGDLGARLESLEWAVSQAAEREASRTAARPLAEVEAELRALESTARGLRRPEWEAVTAADAEAPDLPTLEAEREELLALLEEAPSTVDVEHLADRQSAVQRRVASLEARHGSHDANGDPGAVADIQQNLLARLSATAAAGPQADPVPMILDEAFLRVPADRKWDLLDLLLRLAERHQMVYLSDDAFVAAWARQQAADGKVLLLEPEPEQEHAPTP